MSSLWCGASPDLMHGFAFLSDTPTSCVHHVTSRRRIACPVGRSGVDLSKTLSENRQVEQDVGTGQLNQCQPVLRPLGPASAEAATLAQPGDRPLHHPSSRRMRLAMRVLFL